MIDHNKYPKLCQILAGTNGSDDLTSLAEELEQSPDTVFNEYFRDADEETLQEMEESVVANDSVFEGYDYEMPMEGDDEDFDELVENNDAIKMLYNFIAKHDDTDEFGQYGH